MSRRAPLIGLILAFAAFPAACSNDDDSKGGGAASGGGSTIDVGSGGMGGSGTTDDDDDIGVRHCRSFDNLTDCNSASLKATPVEVNILLVLDSSGSMDSALPDDEHATLWTATKSALTEALGTAQSSIAFGLDLFPNAGPNLLAKVCEMPDSSELVVPIADGPENRNAILSAMSSKGPGGGTPTAAALRRAYNYFSTGDGKDISGSRFVLLATDGGPNCNADISCEIDTCTRNIDADPDNEDCGEGADNCCETFAQGCLDDSGTVDAIETLAAIGVDTFVVGLPGSEIYEEQLNKFAIEGGRPNTEGSESYYKVDSEGAASGLADVLTTITQKLVTSCKIELDQKPVDIRSLNLAVDCTIIPRAEKTEGVGGVGGDGAEDEGSWYYDQAANAAIIQGELCNTIETQGVGSIDLIEGCPVLR